MYGPQELKPLIDQRHEAALQEAQDRRVARQAQADRRPPSRWARVNLIWEIVLSLVWSELPK
jgi:hypothetical protein